MFPRRIREDALLLDERRQKLTAPLTLQKQRADEERLQLRLVVGAAAERLYLSWPRLELQESRPRVPSFYVLDVARAIEGASTPLETPAAFAREGIWILDREAARALRNQ